MKEQRARRKHLSGDSALTSLAAATRVKRGLTRNLSAMSSEDVASMTSPTQDGATQAQQVLDLEQQMAREYKVMEAAARKKREASTSRDASPAGSPGSKQIKLGSQLQQAQQQVAQSKKELRHSHRAALRYEQRQKVEERFKQRTQRSIFNKRLLQNCPKKRRHYVISTGRARGQYTADS